MKALFEIEFGDGAAARKAREVLSQKTLKPGSSLQCTVNKSVLRAKITANTFASMRAISTSFLRDARVFIDSLDLVESAKKVERNGTQP